MPTRPAGAKAPQDHQPKATSSYEEVEVVVGTDDDGNDIVKAARKFVLHGLTLTVEERALNDYRVARLMAKARKGDGTAGVDVLDILLGEEQHDQVAALFADADGYVDGEAIGNFTVEMFRALSPNS